MFGLAEAIEAEGFQTVNGIAGGLHFVGGKDAGNQREAILVQGIGHALGIVQVECLVADR